MKKLFVIVSVLCFSLAFTSCKSGSKSLVYSNTSDGIWLQADISYKGTKTKVMWFQLFDQIDKKLNTPMTTSTGRLLDAVSCLLGFSYMRTYEGEGAMKLESTAYYEKEGIPLRGNVVVRDGLQVLQTSMMVRELLENRNKVNPQKLAYSFHRALAEGLAGIAINSAQKNGLKIVGFTGGVANNEIMTRIIRKKIESEGLRFIRHTKVPPGDGGLSLGQAVSAVYRSS